MLLAREDVVWAYRVMLGREPGSAAEIDTVLQHLDGRDRRFLAEEFLKYAVRQHVGPLVDRVRLNDAKGAPPYLFERTPKDRQTAAPTDEIRAPGSRSNWLDACIRRVRRQPLRDANQSAAREDVLWTYRLLLGRDPASEREIRELAGTHSVDAIRTRLLDSAEFVTSGHLSHLFSAPASPPVPWVPVHQATSGSRVAVVGNCQIVNIARCLQALTGNIVPTERVATLAEIEQIAADHPVWSSLMAEHELVFAHEYVAVSLSAAFPHAREKIVHVPTINFAAFHPDLVYVGLRNSGGWLQGQMGDYNSSIALYGWLHGLSAKETVGLFNPCTYERLGFFNYWPSTQAFLFAEGERLGLPLDDAFQRWKRRGCFMHSVNHPRIVVAADIARMLLHKVGIDTLPLDPENFTPDAFEDGAIWPVYPEIAERLGVEGSHLFRLPKIICPPDRPVLACSLEQYVEATFIWFGQHDKDNIVCERLESEHYRDLGRPDTSSVQSRSAVIEPIAARPQSAGRNPYSGLSDYQFWRRAVGSVTSVEVDPVVVGKFSVAPTDRVATAGSCFAQHIAARLVEQKFNYYVSEAAPEQLDLDEAARRGYGMFSARYGNLYTTRQLSQLLARAYGTFRPDDCAWRRSDGRLADPFRPQIEPEGFATVDELEASRAMHFAAVRRMFESLDVFVFTLGLTESWRAKTDGAVFPLAPGVAAGEMDASRYEFVNFSVSEVAADLDQFIGRLGEINPRARVILTVSPVPLIATYEDRHVLVSTTYSKAVLRVAAEDASRRYPHCAYFPSYEIITGNYNCGSYFERDLRSVTRAGVDHVMRLFFRHYGPAASETHDAELMHEARRVSRIVCDEERIDAVQPNAGAAA